MASTIHVASDPVRRVSAEFLEMPGLRLTVPQASRLFGLPSTECLSLLTSLVQRGFLVRTRDGLYVRPSVRQSGA